MLEKALIENCAPTLAGMKMGNLFSMRYHSLYVLKTEIDSLNSKLNEKGLFIRLLQDKKEFALIYVYRASLLGQRLNQASAQKVLERYGYRSFSVEASLAYLQKRLQNSEGFPHEIGIFLGYPMGDVLGFIEHGGRNCKCCGLWKVYCDECEALKQFERLQKCSRVYAQVFAGGRSLLQMTVVA